MTYLYGTCAGAESVEMEFVVENPSTLSVPCDGVVSRVQIYSRVGETFRVDVEADGQARWRVLATR